MIVPNSEAEIIEHLQGDWERADKKVSFTIFDGNSIRNIKSDTEIKETEFLLDFNPENLKWQLSGILFGTGSPLINFEKDSFTILIKPNTTIVPEIIITERFHCEVRFVKII
jgi:hypothetical protein